MGTLFQILTFQLLLYMPLKAKDVLGENMNESLDSVLLVPFAQLPNLDGQIKAELFVPPVPCILGLAEMDLISSLLVLLWNCILVFRLSIRCFHA